MARNFAGAGAVISAAFALLVAAPTPAQTASAPDIPEATFRAILDCLSHGKEIVMVPQLDCVSRLRGDALAQEAQMPLGAPGWNGDWDEVCRNESDPRRLPANIIKRIAAQKEVSIAPTGIRIIGAVFCGDPNTAGLDLAGLDLTYSLVIDRSVVNGFLDARNLRVKGDFSFENAVILGNLRLNRARVEGSVYGNKSFIDRLRVNDTQINGTWWHREAVVFSDAEIVRANISGDLNLEQSAFSRLWIQSNRIDGTLFLNNSEARCAYHINASTFGFLGANRVGFGTMRTAQPAGQAAIDYAWWDRAVSGTPARYTKRVIESPAIKRIADDALEKIGRNQPNRALVRGCEDTSNSQYVEFSVLNTTVENFLQLTSFFWLVPKTNLPNAAHPTSILSLNGTKVKGDLIIDLWDDLPAKAGPQQGRAESRPVTTRTMERGDADFEAVSKKHRLEAIGLTATALVLDFSDNGRPYFTYIDGLKFDRLRNAKVCPDECDTRTGLPSTDDALHWLDKNAAPSSQPFFVFVAAFEQAGTSATSLRVKQKTVDLCEKTARWIELIAPWCPGQRFSSDFLADPKDASPTRSQQKGDISVGEIFSGVGQIFSGAGEIVTLAFQWTLLGLADHGLRPGKVVWSVGITLLLFLLWFWFILGIVGFEPRSKDKEAAIAHPPLLWPITLLLLFDRLIPAYKIRDEHYAIARVYRKATPDEIQAGPRAPGDPPYPMRYLGKTYSVWPMGDAELRQAEKWLVVLRIIGVVFTVFLLAAINTIVSR